ncbi:ATP-binding cassette domain-containing protein [Nocardioides sp. GY 10113]|uniref:ABC transporter ATP-binding protein n=1 Tax=Nocardioides sp. GY 10113 TaxID=2569761 RepID=UPI0010A753A8|nr:ATP-binding cassette domain-containing protein [Nocardioides sp. GY 10113]TIC79655.1 ATP-binding cassette domain-containing protein [Nocardioides sp. GY 10113]TIC85780.1 ATP-binding cassette domain-containing protein [Nocardioides sp. GY 10113]
MDGPTLAVEDLGKSFGAVRAVDGLSFTVRPGAVTGFLGPNGAGKTTTLRMLLGLTTPTQGRALIGGRAYAEHPVPARLVGAALEASGFHPGRSGLAHLEVYAAQAGVGRARCRELIEMVGLGAAATRRVGGYSMGMRQRLGLATALLADPPAIVLDEPTNGLDPEGIRWMRGLLRTFADEGRTVLVSSHLLSEVQHTVDDVVIIARGRLVSASSLADLSARAVPSTYVEAPDRAALDRLCADRGWTARSDGAGLLLEGIGGADVGAAAYGSGVELHQLVTRGGDLEDLFLRMTGESR